MNNYLDLMHEQVLNTNAVRTLIRNVRIVAEAKNIDLDAISPIQWEGITMQRVGNEPLMRLVLFVSAVMIRNDIGIHEVLCEDPALMIHALAAGNIQIYYEQYPNAAAPPQ